jgi:hypothetical protein
MYLLQFTIRAATIVLQNVLKARQYAETTPAIQIFANLCPKKRKSKHKTTFEWVMRECCEIRDGCDWVELVCNDDDDDILCPLI